MNIRGEACSDSQIGTQGRQMAIQKPIELGGKDWLKRPIVGAEAKTVGKTPR